MFILQLPEAIGNLVNLKILNASSNNIKSLPTWENLECLETLDLAHNLFTKLPDTLEHIHNLKTLNLIGNRMVEIQGNVS